MRQYTKTPIHVAPEFNMFATQFMDVQSIREPSNWREALRLYFNLVSYLEQEDY